MYLSKADGLTYTVVCVELPKGNSTGILIAAETPSSLLGTESVATPLVVPKVMYGTGLTDTLVAAQMEMYISVIKESNIHIHVCVFTIVLTAVNFSDIITTIIELVAYFITETRASEVLKKSKTISFLAAPQVSSSYT